MKRAAKGKKENAFSQCLIAGVLVISSIVYLFLENYPALQPLRDSLSYKLASKLLISGIVFYFTWFFRVKPTRFEQLTLTGFALLPWIPMVIKSDRVLLLLQIILFGIFLSNFIKHFITDKQYSLIAIVATFVLFVMFILGDTNYTYLNNSVGFHFWQIALIVSIILTIVFTILLRKGKIWLEDDRISERAAASILVLFLSFVTVEFLIGNLNYALDTSNPENYSAVILDKSIHSGSKQATYYIFTARIMGEEKEFTVTQSEYYRKDVGDFLTVLRYTGAFGHEYYTYNYS